MELVRQAKAYKDTIHFEIGEPDLPPPPRVKEALREAIDLDRFSSVLLKARRSRHLWQGGELFS